MSASITVLAPLETPRSLPGSPKTIVFNAQVWLGPTQSPLICQFRYFNVDGLAFEDIGFYFLHANVGCSKAHGKVILNFALQILPMHPTLPTHSEDMMSEDYHLIGDIIWVSSYLHARYSPNQS
jgi:hypothetical protein